MSPVSLPARRTAVRQAPVLTACDLLVLGLILERPQHGQKVWTALQHRQAQRWVEISRPQVYYSLRKLKGMGLVLSETISRRGLGRDRERILPTKAASPTLRKALASAHWVGAHEPAVFRTWVVLSAFATRAVQKRQILRRRRFLERYLAQDAKLQARARKSRSHIAPLARALYAGTRSGLRAELGWLNRVERALAHMNAAPE